MSIRNVSMSSLSTRVPRADQRAGYMSLQSTAQHVSSATGAFASSRLLHDGPGGRLDGISTVASLSAALALALPPLLARSAAACAPAKPRRPFCPCDHRHFEQRRSRQKRPRFVTRT